MDELLRIINKVRSNKAMALLDNINESTKLREDLGFDSFDLAELTVRIEEEYNVDIFEDGLVSTIGEVLIRIKK